MGLAASGKASNFIGCHSLLKSNLLSLKQDEIAKDKVTQGAMFVPIIFGSDKVSVGTGNNEYWPIYLSIGNIHNNVRRAHRDGLVLMGFLPIAKSETFVLLYSHLTNIYISADKLHASSEEFRNFRRQLLHTSISGMLKSLCPGFTTPEVNRCPDGHFRRTIYGAGPYIADYPEQCVLSCIVQGWCPKFVRPYSSISKT